jgi:hypothetical protein
VNEVHAALTQSHPRVARALDPSAITTKRDASAFIAEAMAILHPEVG